MVQYYYERGCHDFRLEYMIKRMLSSITVICFQFPSMYNGTLPKLHPQEHYFHTPQTENSFQPQPKEKVTPPTIVK